jgi:cholesterol transport system auxiliary component
MHRIALSLKRSGTRRLAGVALAVAAALALGGCASGPVAPHNRYDLGEFEDAPAQSPGTPRLPPLAVPDVRAPSDLDSDRIHYRLRYRDDLESHSYSTSSWTMTPAQLLTERLRSRLAQRGEVFANPGSSAAPVLQVELLRFEQVFEQPSSGYGAVAFRATVTRAGVVVAQREFAARAPLASADAAGGARALAQASDTALGALLAWLPAPLK